MITITRASLLSVLVLLLAGAASAATPPGLVNYQGVLRDAADNPLSGTYDMVFRFFDASSGGAEILVDRHEAAGGFAVTVTGGLFNVHLGGGVVQDGSGVGSYTALDRVFADYGSVWLQLQVAGETLTPRVRMVSAGYALNSTNLGGRPWSEYLHTGGAQTKFGPLSIDLSEYVAGTGMFVNGYAAAATFSNLDEGGTVSLAQMTAEEGVIGVHVTGALVGAEIENGIRATSRGDTHGAGHFTAGATGGDARVGLSGTGIDARGPTQGGLFTDSDTAGTTARVAYGGYGISADGNTAGGFFREPDSGSRLYGGWAGYGGAGFGTTAGGYFNDDDGSGLAYVAFGERGIWAKGNFAGGTFSHPDETTFWADVSTPTHKIYGTGAVSFVQNHPADPGKVIVYAAPEGDEVATYTRGSGRLSAGRAVVKLGDTFRYVTRPGTGLTAQVTPRGPCAGLYVESVSTSELVVRESAGGRGDVAFDYVVHGLRLGFEEIPVVAPKQRDALPPAPDAIAAAYGGQAALRSFNALERFRAMQGGVAPDEGAAAALRAELEVTRAPVAAREADPPAEAIAPAGAAARPARAAAAAATVKGEPGNAQDLYARSFRSTSTDVATVVPLTGTAEPGDVVVIDAAVPGAATVARAAADRAVFGVVAEEPGLLLGAAGPEDTTARVAVTLSGLARCKVDAGYGAIRPGDLLVTSPTPGHAMRSAEPRPGTLLGKALEALDAGTGTIRIVVLLR